MHDQLTFKAQLTFRALLPFRLGSREAVSRWGLGRQGVPITLGNTGVGVDAGVRSVAGALHSNRLAAATARVVVGVMATSEGGGSVDEDEATAGPHVLLQRVYQR